MQLLSSLQFVSVIFIFAFISLLALMACGPINKKTVDSYKNLSVGSAIYFLLAVLGSRCGLRRSTGGFISRFASLSPLIELRAVSD